MPAYQHILREILESMQYLQVMSAYPQIVFLLKYQSFDDLGVISVYAVLSYIVKLIERDVVHLPKSFQNINDIRGKMFLGKM